MLKPASPSKPSILLKLGRQYLDEAAPEDGNQVLEWQMRSKMLHLSLRKSLKGKI